MRMWSLVAAAVAALALGWTGSFGAVAAPEGVVVSPARRPATDATQPVLSPAPQIPRLEAVLVVDGLDRPTYAVPAGNDQLLVTEKSGVVRLVAHGRVRPVPFLDLEAAIPDTRPEQGLLSIALHPDFAVNGRFFIQFTDGNGDSRLVEYRRSTDKPNQADPRSARLVMAVDQPGQFHNGGMVEFGPDGYLYVGMGDGGFGKPDRNGAELTNTLGSILRIDVDGAYPYSVPADNPYVDSPLAAEIWLNGVRNPWRFFIDPITRQMVIGDVGQFSWEEVTVVPLDTGGLDLGWPRLEGESCYQVAECSTLGLTMPDLVYGHTSGCAVIGGPIYRGSLIPELDGMVLYADYCQGWVRAFVLFDGHVLEQFELVAPGAYGPILSLAVDEDGEVLLLTELGEIRRLQPAR